MMFKALIVGVLVLVVAGHAHADPRGESVFKELSKLVGTWEGTYASGHHHVVDYRLSAHGSALVETWTMSPTVESLTIYTMDGDQLLATHYCPQGNQPRLAFAKKDASGRYRFRFQDGTNLSNSKGSHQHAFWIQLDLPNAFTRSETYVPNGGKMDAPVEEGKAVTYTRVSEARN